MARIFIADDDQLVIDLLSFRLKKRGHIVSSSTDGELALDAILANPPELIILDYQMPVLDAPEIIAAIKAQESTCEIPIIVLTVQWREQDIIYALDSGITDYMTKPFSPDELIFRVDRALKQNR